MMVALKVRRAGVSFEPTLINVLKSPADGSYSIITIPDLNPTLLIELERHLALAIEQKIRI